MKKLQRNKDFLLPNLGLETPSGLNTRLKKDACVWWKKIPSLSILKPNSSYCTSGCSEGSFCWNKKRTRGQFVQMSHLKDYELNHSVQISNRSHVTA